MKRVTRTILLAGALLLVACTTQGPAAPAAAGATPPSAPAAAESAKNVPRGYERKLVDGQEVFCQSDPDLGSRVKRTEKCLTREQLEEAQSNSQRVMQDLQRSGVR